jgi:hypothetical protein
MIEQAHPEAFKQLLETSQHEIAGRFSVYEQLAKLTVPGKGE